MLQSPLPMTLIFLALRLALAGSVPLVEDESYYALWASELAVGYYDHPPMVAWFIWPGVEVFGLTSFGVRITAVLASVAAGLMVWDTVRCLTGETRLGSWAMLFFHLSILTMALGWIATPDAPSTLFWTAGLWAAIRVRASNAWLWWVVLGLAVGAGCISKFTNAFLGLGILFWLVLSSDGRGYLRSVKPYVAMTISVSVMAPYLLWNISHDWIGLERQLERVGTSELRPHYLAQYVLIIFVLPTPLVAYFALRGSIRNTRWNGLLLWATLPLLLYFGFHSLTREVHLNWTAPLHSVIAIWAGVYLSNQSGRRAALGVISAAAISIPVLFVAASPWVPLGSGNHSPNQMRGWQATLEDVHTHIETSGARWVATTEYGHTGHFWYHLSPRPVWSVTEPERYLFRATFPVDMCHETALLILPSDGSLAEARRHFTEATHLGTVERSHLGRQIAQYKLYKVTGRKDAVVCAQTG